MAGCAAGDPGRPVQRAHDVFLLDLADVPKVVLTLAQLESALSERALAAALLDTALMQRASTLVYSFGMTEPVRVEFWGDEIAELRHFDLVTQRTTKMAEVALVLPVDVTGSTTADARYERVSLPALWPPATLVVIPRAVHLEPEMRRTWDEAAHHLDLARRRGENAASRDELYDAPDSALLALQKFPTLELHDTTEDPAAIVFPLRRPESIDRDINKLAALVRGGMPTIILCDNSGQAERLDELLAAGRHEPSPAALAIGVLGGGFVIPANAGFEGLRVLTDHEIFRRERRIRRARRYVTGVALDNVGALTPGDFVVHLDVAIKKSLVVSNARPAPISHS